MSAALVDTVMPRRAPFCPTACGAKTTTPVDVTTVTGSLAQWTEWTGLQFPESGDYVVDGALRPVRMDRPANKGRYDEPLLWMEHPVAQSPGSGHPRPE